MFIKAETKIDTIDFCEKESTSQWAIHLCLENGCFSNLFQSFSNFKFFLKKPVLDQKYLIRTPDYLTRTEMQRHFLAHTPGQLKVGLGS